MKKMILATMILTIFTSASYAQVKIGVDSIPRKGAILDLNCSQKGGLVLSNVFLRDLNLIPTDNPKVFPGITTANNDINPEFTGAIVFNINPSLQPYGIGLYVWMGDRWEAIGFARIKFGTT
ncbi:MAG: hypothetical protein LBR13_00560 [Dysgonamonadaceae bacterium]|jgi:hypothetical protein|nr:hypothetical protein [Dysgonamonadaceae bacterium]